MKHIYLTLVAVAIGCFSKAQVSITGEFRPRAEVRNGYRTMKNNNSDIAFAISQRSRFNFGFNEEKYEIKLSLQDVRVWGDEKYGSDQASVSLHQAWLNYRLSKSLRVKFGRQCVAFDSRMLMSGANWSQGAKKHDALRFMLYKNDWKIDLINAFNQSKTVNSGTDYIYSEEANGNYKNLHVLWVNNKVGNLDWQVMGMAEGFQYAEDTSRTRFTYGAVLDYSFADFLLVGRYFGQGGELVDGTDISSYYWNFETKYQLNKTKFCLGVDQHSGKETVNTDGKSHVFESPYGAKHYINGVMDYFKKNSDTKNTGLTDVYLKCAMPIGEKSILNAHLHYFATAESWYNGNQKQDKYLASELDMYVRTKVDKSIKLEYGLALLKGSNTLAAMQSGDSDKINQWFYFMLTATPKFL